MTSSFISEAREVFLLGMIFRAVIITLRKGVKIIV